VFLCSEIIDNFVKLAVRFLRLWEVYPVSCLYKNYTRLLIGSIPSTETHVILKFVSNQHDNWVLERCSFPWETHGFFIFVQ